MDGNYKNLIQQIKNANLFSKDWEDINDKGVMAGLFKYFSILRKSKIPFLIVYCPRFYERKSQYYNPISKIYEEDKKGEQDIIIENLRMNNENLINKMKDLEAKLNDVMQQLNVKNLEIKNRLLCRKTRRKIKNKKLIKKNKKKEKNSK